MAYLKCMGEWGKKAVFAVSLTCFLANTIHAENNKPTLKEICIKAVKTCDGHSEKIDYYRELSPFQECVANTVAEAQRTGWDAAGEVATELVLGTLKATGYLLKGAANMLFSRKECLSNKAGNKVCWTEPAIQGENETEMDRWERERKEAEEKRHKKIARDKAVLASCSRAITSN